MGTARKRTGGPAGRATPPGPRPSARSRPRASADDQRAVAPVQADRSTTAVHDPPAAPRPAVTRASLTTRAAVLLGVLAILAASYAFPLRAWLDQRAELSSAQAERDALAAEVAVLTEARDLWDDPAYVRAQARERLNFVLPGEVGLVVLGTEATPATPEPVPGPVVPAVEEGQPWWSSLVAAFYEAGAGEPATPDAAPAGQ